MLYFQNYLEYLHGIQNPHRERRKEYAYQISLTQLQQEKNYLRGTTKRLKQKERKKEERKKDTFLAPNRLFYKSCKIQSILNFSMRFSASRRRKLQEYNALGFIAVELWEMVQNRRNKRLKHTKRACGIYTLPTAVSQPLSFWGGVFKGGRRPLSRSLD